MSQQPTLPGAIEAGTRSNFNAGWRFARFGLQADGGTLPEPEGLAAPGLDDGAWRALDLPHDWGIEGPFRIELPGETGKLPWAGIGWYRKHFAMPASERGRRIFLDLDGAMSDSTVFVNGVAVGGWPYGYSSYRIELTGQLRFGADNVVAVRLDNRPDSSRWYPGAGIYRNTWLVSTAPVHVAQWGIYVTTPEISDRSALVRVQGTVDNQTAAPADAEVAVDIWRLGAVPAKVASTVPMRFLPAGGGSTVGVAEVQVADPVCWDLEHPELYCALATVRVGGVVVDTQRTVFGIRELVIDAERGVLLNGRRVRLNGVCNHHDLGALGAALNLRALERQLEILKAMGCNSIRTSHNPPAPELLDLCDRMGFLVLVEAFDAWVEKKKDNDYARFFRQWYDRDVTAMVRRDRNHPSVFLWSVGNEIPEQSLGAKGMAVLRSLTAVVRREDPSRLSTVGCHHGAVVHNGFAEGMDVLGLNYNPDAYGYFHGLRPTKPVMGSETASSLSSRGEYLFPVSDDIGKGTIGFHVSSYDLYAAAWAMIPDREFAAQDRQPFALGEYVWTGFDYLGEPTPFNADPTNILNFQDPAARAAAAAELERLGRIRSPSRSSYFGIIDLCGFPKDRYFLYQARWRPDLPMVHIVPHWTWPGREGEVTPVHVYTSGDEVELFLNGVSLGRKRKEAGQYRLRWNDVVYAPGTVRAVAYKEGKPWAETATTTAGPAARLELAADRGRIVADRLDLAYITVRVVDAQGRLAPRASDLVRFTVAGPGELVAVDNGDPTSLEPFQADRMRAFNGLCLAIVRATGPGAITLRVEAEGLAGGSVVVTGLS